MESPAQRPQLPGATDPERELRQRDYLLRIAQAISSQLDLREVLTRVIRAAVAMTGGHAGAIALRQPGGEMRIAASFKLDARIIDHISDLLEPFDGKAEPDGDAETDPKRRPASKPDFNWEADGIASGEGAITRSSTEPSAPDVARASDALARSEAYIPAGITVHALEDGPEDAQQMLTLPLELAEEVIGRIFVFRSEGAAAFTPLDHELLQTFADQAAVAIQNAEAHMRLSARERRLSSIVEHSPAGVLLLGPGGQVVAHNRSVAALLGREGEDLAGLRSEDMLLLEDELGRGIDLALPDTSEPRSALGALVQEDGRAGAWVQITITPLPDLHERGGFVVDVVDLSGYREAESAKQAFLAGLSHELKTPLALIRGYAETLRYPQVRQDDALYEESIQVILDETEHLTHMVEQLLSAARLESNALTLDLHVVNLAADLDRLVAQFKVTHPNRDWSSQIDPEAPPILADPLRLREVAQNLLSNAVKYSDEGDRITVGAEADPDGGMRFWVEDQGIGIAEADRPRIFQRFFRAAERGEGSGLGLYMAGAIVEAHGGSIEVESHEGLGSRFTVRLPAVPPGSVSEASAQDAQGEAEASTIHSSHAPQEPQA
jgi:PAS domain S-box-containing protein